MESGQARPSRPSGAKQGQAGSSGVKQGQAEQSGTNWGQAGPKWGRTGNTGQTGPNGAKRSQMGLIFCIQEYFHEMKISCLATKALRQILAKLWGFCLFQDFDRAPLKTGLFFLYFSEEIFISSETLLLWLYFEPQPKLIWCPLHGEKLVLSRF